MNEVIVLAIVLLIIVALHYLHSNAMSALKTRISALESAVTAWIDKEK